MHLEGTGLMRRVGSAYFLSREAGQTRAGGEGRLLGNVAGNDRSLPALETESAIALESAPSRLVDGLPQPLVLGADRRVKRLAESPQKIEPRDELLDIGCGTKALAEFCREHDIERVARSGSVLRDDFDPASDIDVLVAFRPGCAPSLFGRMRLERLMAELFRRPVDLVSLDAVIGGDNDLLREEILSTRQVVYEAESG